MSSYSKTQETPTPPTVHHVYDLDYITWNVRSFGCEFQTTSLGIEHKLMKEPRTRLSEDKRSVKKLVPYKAIKVI